MDSKELEKREHFESLTASRESRSRMVEKLIEQIKQWGSAQDAKEKTLHTHMHPLPNNETQHELLCAQLLEWLHEKAQHSLRCTAKTMSLSEDGGVLEWKIHLRETDGEDWKQWLHDLVLQPCLKDTEVKGQVLQPLDQRWFWRISTKQLEDLYSKRVALVWRKHPGRSIAICPSAAFIGPMKVLALKEEVPASLASHKRMLPQQFLCWTALIDFDDLSMSCSSSPSHVTLRKATEEENKVWTHEWFVCDDKTDTLRLSNTLHLNLFTAKDSKEWIKSVQPDGKRILMLDTEAMRFRVIETEQLELLTTSSLKEIPWIDLNEMSASIRVIQKRTEPFQFGASLTREGFLLVCENMQRPSETTALLIRESKQKTGSGWTVSGSWRFCVVPKDQPSWINARYWRGFLILISQYRVGFFHLERQRWRYCRGNFINVHRAADEKCITLQERAYRGAEAVRPSIVNWWVSHEVISFLFDWFSDPVE